MICKNSCCKKEFDGRKRYCPHCGRDQKWVPRKRSPSIKSLSLPGIFGIPLGLALGAAMSNAARKPKYCESCGQKMPEESE